MEQFITIISALFYYLVIGSISGLVMAGIVFKIKEWEEKGHFKGIFPFFIAIVIGIIVVHLTHLPHADI